MTDRQKLENDMKCEECGTPFVVEKQMEGITFCFSRCGCHISTCEKKLANVTRWFFALLLFWGVVLWCLSAFAQSATVSVGISTVSHIDGMTVEQVGDSTIGGELWRTRNCCHYIGSDHTPPEYCKKEEMLERLEGNACEVLQ